MKYVFILTYILISCGSNKTELVHEQKTAKDSISSIEGQIKIEELKVKYGSPDTNSAANYPELKKIKNDMDIASSPEILTLNKKLHLYQKKYDSLEMELKKF